jgi:hypothetical protein
VTTNEATKRFRIRFSLRILLLAFAILAIWLGWNVHQVRQRAAMEKYVASMPSDFEANPTRIIYGTPLQPWKSLPIMWRLLGAKSVQQVELGGHSLSAKDRAYIDAWFPEADIRPVPK